MGATGGKDGFRRAEIRQRRATTLADEVERKNIRPQAELLRDIARQAGTEIAGASADDDGIHFGGLAVGIVQGAHGGFNGERGRVLGKAGLQRVRGLVKRLRERVERKMARVNAVVAAKNFLEDGVRTACQLRKGRGIFERVPASSLLVTLTRGGGSNSNKKHGRL